MADKNKEADDTDDKGTDDAPSEEDLVKGKFFEMMDEWADKREASQPKRKTKPAAPTLLDVFKSLGG